MARRYANIPTLTVKDIGRFWSKVDRKGPDDCWLWLAGHTNKQGYGAFRVGQQMCGAHRVSWMLGYDMSPFGACVLHTCDNPTCVNPNHLWLGTQADNIADMTAKGRRGAAKGARHGRTHLRDADVREIRALFEQRDCTRDSIAKAFGVHKTTIYRIARGDSWKCVE